MNQTDPPSIPVEPLTEAARAQQRLVFLSEASRILGASLDYDTTLKQVAQLLVSGLADWCAIDLLEPDGSVREVAVAHVDPAKTAWIIELRERYPRDMSTPHVVPNVLRTGKSELHPEVPDELLVTCAHDQTHLELMRRVGFRSAMVVPLIVSDVTIGAISFLIGDSAYRFSKDDLILAEDLARRAAIAVENARLHAAEQAARHAAQLAAERLSRLQRVTAELSEALTVERVAEIVVDQGLAALDADAGSVALLTPDGLMIEVVRAANCPQQLTEPWKRFPLATDAPLAETVRTGDPLFFESLERLQDRYPALTISRQTPNRAFAAVPLVVDRLLLGSLGLSFRQEREFTPDDREFICAVARQCGQAIQRARLYEAERAARAEAEAARERLTFLSEAATVLTSSLEYGDTLNTVARVAVPSFADFSLLFLMREDEAIELAEVTHVDPKKRAALFQLLTDYPLEPGQSVGASLALRTGAPEFVPDFTEEVIAAHGHTPDYQRRLRAFGLTSRIVVPLRARGRTFGALSLLQAESGRRFTPDDVALAEELGWRAAVAIDNARLFAEVRDADRRKNEFLAILAHELRNPLAPIRNSLELLQPRSSTGSALEPRAIIERQVSLMVRLVDDLLDVSRITRGKIELRRGPVRLDKIIRNAIQTSLPLILERGHVFPTEGVEAPIWLEADATRLEQVVTNLLNNAAKYTKRGGLIRLTVNQTTVEPRMAIIRITDNGIGIDPAMLPRVFEPFAQADSSLGRQYGGLGLGLTLVQNLVRLHGGKVVARSDGPGTGSEFEVWLPILDHVEPEPRDSPSPETAPSTEPSEGNDRDRLVLVVDDNIDGALTLAEIIETWGCETQVAHSGSEALELAAERRPETVLLDIGMPGMDGYEVARRLRAREQEAVDAPSDAPNPPRMRIIALTGYGQDNDRQRAWEAGFDHHFTKPVDLDALRGLLAAR